MICWAIEHGPLARAVTYGALFRTGYGLALGPVFGLASGLAHGITLAWEYSRASRHEPKPGFWLDTAMSAIRGCGFALGASYSFGAAFRHHVWRAEHGRTGNRLSDWHRLGTTRPATRPRMTRFQLLAAANRTVGYAVGGYVSSLVAQQRDHAIAVGLKAGLAIGVVTAIAGSCTPFVEWTADQVPEKRMGVFGVDLILIGFTLQSAQHWAVLLDVKVR